MRSARFNLLFCMGCIISPNPVVSFIRNASPAGSTLNRRIFGSGARGPTLADNQASVDDLTTAETQVYNLVQDLHQCGYPFRIVVIGNGAILETTSELGPKMKLGKSPKTGEHLITLANDDQSFEFHMKTSQVSKVSLAQVPKPDSDDPMRLFRFVSKEGKPMCSLILRAQSSSDENDGSSGNDAGAWFDDMVKRYGDGLEL